MATIENKIYNFWEWFRSNNGLLLPKVITNNLIDKLNEKILDIEDFAWEIREGLVKDNMLIISAGSNKDLFSIAKQTIRLAPNIDCWEFYYYKPAVDWNYILSIKDERGFNSTLDVKKWEYVLLKFPDNTFDIIIYAPNILKYSNDDKHTIVDIVLEKILGEDLRYRAIINVEIVNRFEKIHESHKTLITKLGEHLKSLLD